MLNKFLFLILKIFSHPATKEEKEIGKNIRNMSRTIKNTVHSEAEIARKSAKEGIDELLRNFEAVRNSMIGFVN